MRRRSALLLLLPLAAVLHADDREGALAAVEPFAAALGEGNTDEALRFLPESLIELRSNVAALLGQALCTSSINVLEVADGSANLDWYLQIRARATETLLERRQARIRVRWNGKRIVSLEPASFFAAPANLSCALLRLGRPGLQKHRFFERFCVNQPQIE